LINALVEGTSGDDDQTADKRCLESEPWAMKNSCYMLQSWNLRYLEMGTWWNHVFLLFFGPFGGVVGVFVCWNWMKMAPKEHPPPPGTLSPGCWGGSSRQSCGARGVARSGPRQRIFFPSDSLAPWQRAGIFLGVSERGFQWISWNFTNLNGEWHVILHDSTIFWQS
jgi:hypothetical protein